MLHSGVDVHKTFQVVARKTGQNRCRAALEQIATDIRRGDDITTSMRRQRGLFPPLMVDMVHVAEESGALPEVLEGLADHYENTVRLRRAFLQGIAWPAFQLVAAILIIALVIALLGIIAESNKGAPIDLLGLGLMGVDGAITWLVLTFGSLACGFLLVKIVSRGLTGKRILHSLAMRIPVVGYCMRSFAIARFSWAFSLTQGTGMPIEKSLDSSLKATANGVFIASIPMAVAMIRSGETLHDTLAETQLFPEDFLHMVLVGESTGTVPEALARLSPQFEDQARRSLSALTSAAAWTIWALVAAFIVFFIFRIMMFYVGMINNAAQGILPGDRF
ncbi:MAG: type II secretion system F family protein [Planctomycetaceae bacterium]|nr:type II secretion system F family protein [Planctomycetaceae bacterium]